MTIYILIYSVLFFLSLIERLWLNERVNVLYKNLVYWSAVIGIIFFAGLRYQSGPDYFSYQQIYNSIESWSFSRFEPGFVFTVYISKYLFELSYESFLFCFTAIIILIKALFFNKYFKYPCFILFLYFSYSFIFADFGQIRNGMALSIFLWMIPAIKNKNFIKYIILFCLAASFHYSVLITFPLYWVSLIKIDVKKFCLLYIMSFILYAIDLPILIISFIIKFFPDFTISQILKYIISAYATGVSPIIFFADFGGFITIILIILYNKAYAYEIRENQDNNLELIAYKADIVLFIFMKSLHSVYAVTARGSHYAGVMEYFLIYYIFTRIKEKESKLLYIFLFFLYGFIKLAFYIAKYYESYMNYRLNWEVLGF